MNLITKGFILLLAFTSFKTQAEPLLQGKVKSKTAVVLPGASIEYLHHKTGCMANAEGKFALTKIVGDSIQISAVGYMPVVIAIEEKTSYLQPILTEDEAQLEDVNVKARKMKTVSLGYYSGFSFFHDYRGPGTENSILIPNKDLLFGYLTEIKFKITNADHSPWNLRVRIRIVDTSTGFPSSDTPVFEEDIPAASLKKVNRLIVKDKKILLPATGIFVSLEWLHPENEIEKTYVHAFITPALPGQKVAERKAYFRFTGNSTWHSQISPDYPNSYFAVEDRLYAPCISILVSTPKQ